MSILTLPSDAVRAAFRQLLHLCLYLLYCSFYAILAICDQPTRPRKIGQGTFAVVDMPAAA